MAVTVPFEKYHGTGNEFVVVDASEYVPDRGAFAAAVCDRREAGSVNGARRERSSDGVRARGPSAGSADERSESAGVSANAVSQGSSDLRSDGVLFLALESRYSPPRVVMTLVQPDGDTAPMCGNGARCAAHWAARRTGSDAVMIDTQAGTRRAVVDGDEVTVEMGLPSLAPDDVPLDRATPLVGESIGGFEVTAVDTGVPHAVAFVDDVTAVDVERVAPRIRHADAFPKGANVTFASGRSDGGFDQRTFERGVEGETSSCGTGAVAVVAAARRHGRVAGDDPVVVRPPGGALEVVVSEDGRSALTGPVVREFEGAADPTPVVDRPDGREA